MNAIISAMVLVFNAALIVGTAWLVWHGWSGWWFVVTLMFLSGTKTEDKAAQTAKGKDRGEG